MPRKLSVHIRSKAVPYLALFFAISGTAYATHPGGANTISTVDIINGEVQAADFGTGEVRTRRRGQRHERVRADRNRHRERLAHRLRCPRRQR